MAETPTPTSPKWQIVLELTAVILFILLAAVGLLPLPVSTTVALLVVGSASIWLRRQRWRHVGLRRPDWPRALLVGIGAGVAIQLVSSGIVTPLLGSAPVTGDFGLIRGNLLLFLVSLAIMWLLAAFGEELAYRGYLLQRLADLFGRERGGWIISVLVTTAVFSLAHWSSGVATMLETAVTGLIFAALALWRRNLWPAIIAHGVSNSIVLTLIYLGIL